METAVVIGGGVIGMATALQLQKNKVQVVVVDPLTPIRPASWGNAGHIAIEQIAPIASLATLRSVPRRLFSPNGGLSLPIRDIGSWAPFALRLLRSSAPRRFEAGRRALALLMQEAMPAWRRFVAALGAPELLLQEGHFVLWGSREKAVAGRAAWQSADTGTTHFRDADESELALLSAPIGREIGGAIRCVGSGQISDPDDLAEAMKTCLSAAGGVLHRGSARAVLLEKSRASVLLEDETRLKAALVLVAAGIGSRSLMEGLNYRVPMIAERGYHVQYPGAVLPGNLPPIVFEDRAMIVTRFRSGVRVSGHLEFSAPLRPADPGKWERLRAHVKALNLPLEAPGETWMGARPTLPDYLPAIGRSRRASNLFYAFGHQHLGLTLAPITAELTAALALGRSPAVSLTPFDLERFQTGAIP